MRPRHSQPSCDISCDTIRREKISPACLCENLLFSACLDALTATDFLHCVAPMSLLLCAGIGRGDGTPSHDDRRPSQLHRCVRAGEAIPLLHTGFQDLEGIMGAAPNADKFHLARFVGLSAAVQLRVRPPAGPPRDLHEIGRSRQAGAAAVCSGERLSLE